MQTSLPVRRYSTVVGDWGSLIGLLMVQEIGRRFHTSRFGALLALAEPILLICAIATFREEFKGMLPQFGTSVFVFVSSGIFPFYVFLRVSTRSRGARYDAAHRLPTVTTTETLIASILAETVLILASMVLWFTALWLGGIEEARPVALEVCVVPLSLLVVIGIGIGLVNAAISRRFPLWLYIYGIPGRALMILSGAYYIVDLLPLFFRDVVVWNPIAHGIEWFRLGQYGEYPVITLDRDYFIVSAVIALIVGIAAHRVTVRAERG